MEAFRDGISHPESFLPERAIQRLKAGHGHRWRGVVANWGQVWLALNQMEGDLYLGRLPEIRSPALIFHGLHDPHTDAAEIEALAAQISGAQLQLLSEAGHSPHSQRESRDQVNRQVKAFLQGSAHP